MLSTAYTLDTTGEVIAESEGTADRPNEVYVHVDSGTILVGGAAADALFEISAADGIIPFNLVGSDSLYAKASASTVDIVVIETTPKTR